MSSAEPKPSEWDIGTMCKDCRFYHHLWIVAFIIIYGFVVLCKKSNDIYTLLSWRTVSVLTRVLFWCLFPELRSVFVLTRVLFWCLFPELRSNSGNQYQNNTRVSTETVRHESTYTILYICDNDKCRTQIRLWWTDKYTPYLVLPGELRVSFVSILETNFCVINKSFECIWQQGVYIETEPLGVMDAFCIYYSF